MKSITLVTPPWLEAARCAARLNALQALCARLNHRCERHLLNENVHASGANVEVVANAIMTYVGAHVEAADSVTGISEWWLRDLHGAAPCVVTVGLALEQLVHRGRLHGERGADGTIVYCARHVPGTMLRLLS